mmetsp:Transcript_6464/g.8480  ORF Transcript_6464/g.8480 Transcript_6464/m.8480 type:complete len:337 (-) Transcript_6464:1080-2090(-)
MRANAETRACCLQVTGIRHRTETEETHDSLEPTNVDANHIEAPPQVDDELPIAIGKSKSNSCWDMFALRYCLLAFFDVEANVIVTFAYRYTSLTSIMLLDCFTIPFVMCLSGAFLGTRYSWIHFAGVVICLIGLIFIILSDALTGRSDIPAEGQDIPKRVWGDILCIIGALFYAISNVWQEKIVKEISREEFLSMIGTWGVSIAFIQSFLFEDWSTIEWSNIELISGFGLYVFVIVLYYILVSKFLLFHDATFLNISILTSDVWGIALGYIIFHQVLHWLCFIGFATVIVGAFMYNKEPVCHTSVSYNPDENEEERNGFGEEYERVNADLESLSPS